METKLLTKKDFDADGNFIGNDDVLNFNGNLEIDENLRTVKFKFLNIRGYIYAKAGSGIEARWGIEAGWGIKAGWGIEAGEGIKAGWGIEAGWDIKAGEGIEAGWGIKAGEGITCKLILSIKLRIFAGLCLWRNPTKEEMQIKCGKLESGTICYGELIETGLPKEEKEISLSGQKVTVTVGNKTYSATID